MCSSSSICPGCTLCTAAPALLQETVSSLASQASEMHNGSSSCSSRSHSRLCVAATRTLLPGCCTSCHQSSSVTLVMPRPLNQAFMPWGTYQASSGPKRLAAAAAARTQAFDYA